MEENKAIEGAKPGRSFSQMNVFEKLFYMIKSIGGTLVYPNVLLFQLVRSRSVSTKQKLLIFGALLYILSPIDFISEVLVWGLGFADDLVAVIAVITALLSCFTDEVQAETKALMRRHLGEYDDRGIEALSKIIQTANHAVLLKKMGGNTTAPKPTEPQTVKPIDVEVEEVKVIQEAKPAETKEA